MPLYRATTNYWKLVLPGRLRVWQVYSLRNTLTCSVSLIIPPNCLSISAFSDATSPSTLLLRSFSDATSPSTLLLRSCNNYWSCNSFNCLLFVVSTISFNLLDSAIMWPIVPSKFSRFLRTPWDFVWVAFKTSCSWWAEDTGFPHEVDTSLSPWGRGRRFCDMRNKAVLQLITCMHTKYRKK